MLTKTITWTDWNGTTRTEDFLFNLTRTELTKMEMKYPGGLIATVNKLVKSENNALVLEIFNDIIMTAYGEKDADGRRFVKNNGELAEAFSETGAYDALFTELVSVEGAAAAFIKGIMPKDITTAASSTNGVNVSAKAPLAIPMPTNE